MGDLISRAAAIDAITQIKRTDNWTAAACMVIYELPSAQRVNRLEMETDGKSPEDVYDFLYWLMFDYARAFTDSRAAVIAWLKGENDG